MFKICSIVMENVATGMEKKAFELKLLMISWYIIEIL